MQKNNLNIYMCGMGGQGIAFLSRILIESCLEAGYPARGCDTHGMAQRGGTVVGHLRLGQDAFTPLIPPGTANLVIGLERLEAMRGMQTMSAPGSTVVYYDAVYHPVIVRIGKADYPEDDAPQIMAQKKGITLKKISIPDLPSPRLQNTAILASIAAYNLIPGVTTALITEVMERLLPAAIKARNLETLEKVSAGFSREKKRTT